jgi:plasmid stabilization system protein ParE
MAYLVNITPRAERDLAHLYRQIHAEFSAAALKWYKGLKEATVHKLCGFWVQFRPRPATVSLISFWRFQYLTGGVGMA